MLDGKEAEQLVKTFLEAKKQQGWEAHPRDFTCGFLRKKGAVNAYAIVGGQVANVSVKAEKLEEIIPRVQYPDLYREIDDILSMEVKEMPPPPSPQADPPARPAATLGDRAIQAAHAAANVDAETASKVLATGNLELLSPVQKVQYYNAVCQSLGLNPLTRPFDYITFWRGKSKVTQLYAKRDCTDQLRAIHNISVEFVERRNEGDIYIVTAKATTPDGRSDVSTGAKALAGRDREGKKWKLEGEGLANAMMTAETKAKRRVTLSICGLGFLDETEVATIPDATVGGS